MLLILITSFASQSQSNRESQGQKTVTRNLTAFTLCMKFEMSRSYGRSRFKKPNNDGVSLLYILLIQ